MNWRSPGLLLLVAGFASAETDTLKLLNGDRMKGSYRGQEGARVVFQSEWAEAPFRIHGKFVEFLHLPGERTGTQASYDFLLTDGDRLTGDPLRMEGEFLILRTDWNPEMKLRLRSIQTVQRRTPPADLLYQGPDGPEKWKLLDLQGKASSENLHQRMTPEVEGWRFSGNLSFHRDLPKASGSQTLKWTAEIPPGTPTINAMFDVSGLPPIRGGARSRVSLQVVGNMANLRTYDARKRMDGSIRLNFPVAENGLLNVECRLDAKNRDVTLYLNQTEVYRWDGLVGDFDKTPGQLAFTVTINPGVSSPYLILRELLLIKENAPRPDLAALEGMQRGGILLRNNDGFPGRLTALNKEGIATLQIEGAEAEMSLPFDRIERIEMPPDVRLPSRREPRHVRVKLKNGEDQFIMAVQSADADSIRFTRGDIEGEQTLPLRRIRILELNPYTTPLEPAGMSSARRWLLEQN